MYCYRVKGVTSYFIQPYILFRVMISSSYQTIQDFRCELSNWCNDLLNNSNIVYDRGRIEIYPYDRDTLGDLYEASRELKNAARNVRCSVKICSSYTNDYYLS